MGNSNQVPQAVLESQTRPNTKIYRYTSIQTNNDRKLRFDNLKKAVLNICDKYEREVRSQYSNQTNRYLTKYDVEQLYVAFAMLYEPVHNDQLTNDPLPNDKTFISFQTVHDRQARFDNLKSAVLNVGNKYNWDNIMASDIDRLNEAFAYLYKPLI